MHSVLEPCLGNRRTSGIGNARTASPGRSHPRFLSTTCGGRVLAAFSGILNQEFRIKKGMSMLIKRLAGFGIIALLLCFVWQLMPKRWREKSGMVPASILGLAIQILKIKPSIHSAQLRDGRSIGGIGLNRIRYPQRRFFFVRTFSR
jgi:hypothetical protein